MANMDIQPLLATFGTLQHPIAIVDIESTGGHLIEDRVTEVALILINQDDISYHSWLINPMQPITPFVAKLTGINDKMVKDAPSFTKVAPDIFALLKDAIIVAHNVKFDYGFLKNEFLRAGYQLRTPVLCTVKLSKRLYPEHHKHSLDTIIERFKLQLSGRHRAMPDAEALLYFCELSLKEKGNEVFGAALNYLITPKPLSKLPDTLMVQLETIPDDFGVYSLIDSHNNVLTCQASARLYQDVYAQFARNKRPEWLTDIQCIDYRTHTGMFSASIDALLRQTEQARVNESTSILFTITLTQNDHGFLNAHVVPLNHGIQKQAIYGLFAHPKAAKKALSLLSLTHNLCQASLGILPTTPPLNTPCPQEILGQCNGACVGRETASYHNKRVIEAMQKLPIKDWPFNTPMKVIETHPITKKTESFIFERGALRLPEGVLFFHPKLSMLLKPLYKNKEEYIQIEKINI